MRPRDERRPGPRLGTYGSDMPSTRSDRDWGILIRPSTPAPARPSGSAGDTRSSDGRKRGALMYVPLRGAGRPRRTEKQGMQSGPIPVATVPPDPQDVRGPYDGPARGPGQTPRSCKVTGVGGVTRPLGVLIYGK